MKIRVIPILCFLVGSVLGHDSPEPMLHLDFGKKFLKDGVLVAQKGSDLRLPEGANFVDVGGASSLLLEGKGALVGEMEDLPEKDLTVSAWVTVTKDQQYGGLVGYFQDNGSAESGWVLGYGDGRFSFALGSEGNERMTYLKGKTRFELGRVYFVTGTYDGEEMRLYVNGELDGRSDAQSGKIRYPGEAVLAVGGYKDANEDFGHAGVLREVKVYDLAATEKGVKHVFGHGEELAKVVRDEDLVYEFEAEPFLQMAGVDSMGVNWATTVKGDGKLFWGPTAACEAGVVETKGVKFHQVRITGLEEDTQYFYRTETTGGGGQVLRSEVKTFETAPEAGSPIAFAVISDMQGNPAVASKMASYAWAQRPDFLVIPGDLTSTGRNQSHWTEQFFPSMEELISRVPMYPVLGNHEQNSHWYYDYMNLPAPEYYYTFNYGPAQFFMIDSNKKCGPGSEQFAWLEKELKASEAEWKMVVHHHPVYSSDENDYGDLWKTNKSTRGDRNVRAMSVLYDKYGVDVVFNGHIHSYERTWQVKGGKVVAHGGVQYFITGGGGGPLERAGPSRPKFQNTVKRGHHYAMVRINGDVFEWQAYDVDGRLFDSLRYERKE